jgi:hypothetical protein
MPDAARFQPLCHPDQIRRPAAKLPYRLRVTCRRHSHILSFVADIDARYMLMDNLQSGIVRAELPGQLLALLAVQFTVPAF